MSIIQDFILYLGTQLTDSEKLECVPTAINMVDLAKKVQRDGILSLENEVEEHNEFMKMGINLILEGLPVDAIERILHYSILSGGYTNKDLMNKLIMTQGLISITNHYSPFVTAQIVGSIIGEKFISEITSEVNKSKDLNTIIDKNTFPLAESINFEERLLELTRVELSQLLMPIHNFVIAMAFKGCNKFFIKKMRDGLSTNRYTEICETFSLLTAPIEEDTEYVSLKTEALQHQAVILIELEKLESSGIIIKTR